MSVLERARRVRKSGRVTRGSGARSAEHRETLRSVKRAALERVGFAEVAHLAAEPDTKRARAELRPAIEAVLNAQGHEDMEDEERERIVAEALDDVVGLGPLQELIEDEAVSEIMVNGCTSTYIERKGTLHPLGPLFDDDEQIRILVDRILSPLGRRVDERSPIVNARLQSGYRVNAVVPPVAIDGTALTIRKFSNRISSLTELVGLGSLPDWYARLLSYAVVLRQDLAVAGGTGSGKTTLLNALSCEIPVGERIVTIEDSAELKFARHPHVVRLEARAASIEGGEHSRSGDERASHAAGPHRCGRGARCRMHRYAPGDEYRSRWVAYHASCGNRGRGDRTPRAACALRHQPSLGAYRGTGCDGARRHRHVRAQGRWQALRVFVFGGSTR